MHSHSNLNLFLRESIISDAKVQARMKTWVGFLTIASSPFIGMCVPAVKAPALKDEVTISGKNIRTDYERS